MNARNAILTASNDREAIKLFQMLTGKLGAHVKMKATKVGSGRASETSGWLM